MLSAGEQGQLIDLPYNFALEVLMADGSAQNITAFDETISITIKLTEQELTAIGNTDKTVTQSMITKKTIFRCLWRQFSR